jgi:hypothetical protein
MLNASPFPRPGRGKVGIWGNFACWVPVAREKIVEIDKTLALEAAK